MDPNCTFPGGEVFIDLGCDTNLLFGSPGFDFEEYINEDGGGPKHSKSLPPNDWLADESPNNAAQDSDIEPILLAGSGNQSRNPAPAEASEAGPALQQPEPVRPVPQLTNAWSDLDSLNGAASEQQSNLGDFGIGQGASMAPDQQFWFTTTFPYQLYGQGPNTQQQLIPAALAGMGSTLPSQYPYKYQICLHEGYQSNPYANHSVACHNDYSGANPLNGESRYPDPDQMAQTGAPPYGSYNSGRLQSKQPIYNQHLKAPNPQAVGPSAAGPDRQPQPRKRPAAKRRRSSVSDVVIHQRKAKRQKRSNTIPDNVYLDDVEVPDTWGPPGEPSLFKYNKQGRFPPGRKYNAKQIRSFIDFNPREMTLWVQNHPAQCKDRLPNGALECIWECCPAPASGKIVAGWLQVAFDEFPQETSNGTRDPFNVAGVMHLWCYEQCCDIIHDYERGLIQPEDRRLPREQRNPMRLERDNSDMEAIDRTFHPWFKNNAFQMGDCPRSQPRPHEETLSHAMIQHHLDHQIAARAAAREKRNWKKSANQKCTIDIHIGDLRLWAQRRFASPSMYAADDFAPSSENRFQVDVNAQQQFVNAQQWAQSQQNACMGNGNQATSSMIDDIGINDMDLLKQYNQMDHVGVSATLAAPAPSAPEPQSTPQPVRQGEKRSRDAYDEAGDSSKRQRTSPSPEATRRSPHLAGNQPTLQLPQTRSQTQESTIHLPIPPKPDQPN